MFHQAHPHHGRPFFNNAVGVGAVAADNAGSRGRQRTAESTQVNRDPISSTIFLATFTWISGPLRVTVHSVIKDIIWAGLSFTKLQESEVWTREKPKEMFCE